MLKKESLHILVVFFVCLIGWFLLTLRLLFRFNKYQYIFLNPVAVRFELKHILKTVMMR